VRRGEQVFRDRLRAGTEFPRCRRHARSRDVLFTTTIGSGLPA
jgi:hypothetical protein